MLAKGFIKEIEIFLVSIVIRDIEPNICIQNHEKIKIPAFQRRRQEGSSNENRSFPLMNQALEFSFQLIDFSWRSHGFRSNDQTLRSKLLFEELGELLDSNPVFFDIGSPTTLTVARKTILFFTDMTKPELLTTRKEMIIDRYRTMIALRNMSTLMADYSSIIAFFIDEDSDFFACSEVFSDPFLK